jgi:hypothetical protein
MEALYSSETLEPIYHTIIRDRNPKDRNMGAYFFLAVLSKVLSMICKFHRLLCDHMMGFSSLRTQQNELYKVVNLLQIEAYCQDGQHGLEIKTVFSQFLMWRCDAAFAHFCIFMFNHATQINK